MRAAVVGAGLMGRWHAQALRRLGLPLVAVVDTNRAAAVALARSDASAFDALDACLEQCDVEVVHVCTPLDAHADLVRTALSHGAHVLVEKPLAQSLAETRELLDAASAAGVLLAPVHQFPFQRGFRKVVAERARLGELVRVAYRTCSAGGDGKPPDARRAILKEILPHPVSLFSRLVPNLDVARLEVRTFDDDELVLSGRADSAQLEIFISLRGRPTRNELEAIGTRGSASADLFGGYAVFENGRVSRGAKIARPFRLGSSLVTSAGVNVAARASRWEPAYPGLRELIREFHDAAARGGEPPISRAETLAAAELIDAVPERA
jgi:predicted dehydrogenase